MMTLDPLLINILIRDLGQPPLPFLSLLNQAFSHKGIFQQWQNGFKLEGGTCLFKGKVLIAWSHYVIRTLQHLTTIACDAFINDVRSDGVLNAKSWF